MSLSSTPYAPMFWIAACCTGNQRQVLQSGVPLLDGSHDEGVPVFARRRAQVDSGRITAHGFHPSQRYPCNHSIEVAAQQQIAATAEYQARHVLKAFLSDEFGNV